MNWLMKRMAGPYVTRYHDTLRRIHDLEVAVDSMILSPVWKADLSKALNGQKARQGLFNDILGAFDIAEVIETGTFLGDTTGYFAHLLPNVPVRSCELSPRFAGLAKMRLGAFSNVEVLCSDSRLFLSGLDNVASTATGKVSLVYLDAHWHSDLPLQEELEILSKKRPAAIIVIDDFQVPDDPGYSFDNYGRGRELTLGNFRPLFDRQSLNWFFPASASAAETGHRRGCVVLAPVGPLSDRLSKIRSLRRAGTKSQGNKAATAGPDS
jgi:predicted O-methyltransferase YrrM